VVVDDQLNFEEHMNEKINKANSIMGLTDSIYCWHIPDGGALMPFKASRKLFRPYS
jgi:hypothetical protein